MSESGQVGQLLAQTREAQNRTLQEVANELKLSVSFVKAIEAEECNRLPDVAFVRGYVRNYARLLGLSKEQTQQVVAHYEAIMKPAQELPQGAPVVAPKTQGPRWWRLVWLVAAVLVIGQVFYMWHNAKTPTSEGADELPQAETLTTTPSETAKDEVPLIELTPAEPAADAPSEETLTIEEVPEPIEQEKEMEQALEDSEALAEEAAIEEAATEAEEQAQPSVEEATTPEANVVLAFNDECWVSVVDATGKTLYSGIQQAGETLALEGQAPYQFVFGNGAALESMQVEGKAISLPERRAGQVWRYHSQ